MPPPARPFAGFFRLTANDVAEFIGQATDKTKSYPVRSLMEVAQISRDEILDYLNHLYIVVTPVTLARDILAQEISEAVCPPSLSPLPIFPKLTRTQEQVLADEDILAAFYERTGQDRNLLKTVVRLNEAGLKTLNTYINPVINEMVKLMDEKWRRVRRGDWREEGADERIAGMMERLKRGDLVVHREGEGSELGV